MIPPCLTLSNIRYVSRLKWSSPGKGVAPFPTPRCSSYWKGSLLVLFDYGRQLTYFMNISSRHNQDRNEIKFANRKMYPSKKGGVLVVVMVKAMDCGIVVREFVLQSRYYVHFRANILGKGIEPPYPPSYGLNSTSTVLLGEWLWH